MKLELKHLAGYLPYGLKCIDIDDYSINSITGLKLKKNEIWYYYSNGFKDRGRSKPILHPLSDLTKEIEVNGEKFVPIDKIAEIEEVVCTYSIEFFETSLKYLPHWIVEKLLEWHFDIHRLIEKGLAIDINTLKL